MDTNTIRRAGLLALRDPSRPLRLLVARGNTAVVAS